MILLTVGLVVLLLGGLWQLVAARSKGLDPRRWHLVSTRTRVFRSSDRRRPWRVLTDPGKRRNAIAVLAEVGLLVAAAVSAGFVVTHPLITDEFKAVATASLTVGALLVGRGLYVRLGLYGPTLEDVDDYRASLARIVDESVAAEFVDVHGAVSSARGDGGDELTITVLATARRGRDLEEVVEWAEATGVADAGTFRSRAETLADAGVVAIEDGHLRVGDALQGADHRQMATVALTAVN